MTYESQKHSSITRLMGTQLRAARNEQLKRDCKALLSGGMPSASRSISQGNPGHTTVRNTVERPRPQNATGLLATDWALDDYNTWK